MYFTVHSLECLDCQKQRCDTKLKAQASSPFALKPHGFFEEFQSLFIVPNGDIVKNCSQMLEIKVGELEPCVST